MIYLPIAIFWLLGMWAVFSRWPVLLFMFFGSVAFGSLAVIPPALTGGLTLTATPMLSLLVIARAFLSPKGPDFFLQAALSMRKLGLLFLFLIVAILSTIFLPRLFEGAVMVVPFRGELGETSPLEPTPQNLSQVLYVTISVLTVFAFARILRSPADRQMALNALVFGAILVVLTGFVDYLSQFLPLSALLDVFRTASYAMATDVEVLGGKRVVGLMPEASAYGGTALGFLSMLVFFRRMIASRRVREIHAPVLIGLLVLLCYLSKSSGTLLGVGLLGAVMVADGVLRAFAKGRSGGLHRRDLVGEISVVLALLGLVGLFAILIPHLLDPVYELIDRMLFEKTQSYSYYERGMWRRVALESVLATGGLGVGLGGTRSSSHLAAIFSGAGVVGGLLYVAFLLQTLMRRSAHMDLEGQLVLSAFRFSFLAPFCVSLLVGGPDFGPTMAFGFGIVTATVISKAPRRERRLAPHLARGARPEGPRGAPAPRARLR